MIGAEALYSPEGKTQIAALIAHYMGNAGILREAASSVGLRVYGGDVLGNMWRFDVNDTIGTAGLRS